MSGDDRRSASSRHLEHVVPLAAPTDRLPRRAEVAVIGGGVMGVSIAYHLAAAGVRPVLVLERDTLGSGSSADRSAASGHLLRCREHPARTSQPARRLGVTLSEHAEVLDITAEPDGAYDIRTRTPPTTTP